MDDATKCFFCGGAAHAATGCQYTGTALSCRRCTVDFWSWFQNHQYRGLAAAKAMGSPPFYDAINAAPRKVSG